MSEEVNLSILVEEKLKNQFEKKCDGVHRSMASQIRYFMELWIADKLEVKE